MVSYIFLLHQFLFFITATTFFPAVYAADSSENANYTACSVLYSCGGIQNVGYPFWGDNRPKFCGMPGFKLSCDSNNNISFDLIQNVSPGLSLGLKVHDINTSSHTMEFSIGNLLQYCYLQNKSYTLVPNLQKADPNTNITLFYGCNKTICSSRPRSFFFTCSNNSDGTTGTGFYFGNNRSKTDISRISKSCRCKNNITVPVAKKELDALVRSTSASFLSTLHRQLIEIRYKANFTACSKCEKSGGKCGTFEEGSSSNQYQFVCFCKNGAHAAHHQRVCLRESEEKRLRRPSLRRLGLGLGLGIAGAMFVFVAIIITIWFYKKLKFVARSASLGCSAPRLEKESVYFGVPLYSYGELVDATANFDQSNVIGKGGFGIVYYGKLKDGREVAVKRLYEKSCKRVEQFMNEVELLTRLRHQNLVSLYGCTSQHCEELILVYEFVKNGTLADHLHGERAKTSPLPWLVRLRIAIETATALSYLHASDIIHRDIKSNNILLDSNFFVKVADFGLSRLFPTDVTHVSTAPQGTPGYLDPEYHQCYQLTDKSDVYSFGVVLIQLISSLPAIDLHRHKHEINLSNYAVNRIQRCAFDELVDPQLGHASDFKVRRMTRLVAELAFQCLQHDKEFRPSMNEVLEVLKRIESADYEALLKAENMAKTVEDEVVNVHTSNPPPLDVEDDQAKLLNDGPLLPSSPISVVEKWVSRSITPSK